MNSMFSVFDALCAEFLGQTIKPSFASTSATSKDGYSFFKTNKAGVAESMKKTQQEGNVEKKQQRAPRFAPELDGINCFETLVSY
ncbi:hypothetical protein CCACVL1_13320 [Corchorus capsularis]|uniref:Avr9/Cf-9 rapidly elicited protein n=1 Tax=Corchorus capsularis TaxID=210143 RepID=A0A1R3IBI3_COCAP|nr:hypothetical protein CCACVL1_13320 [Corchorus capsularis]